MHGCCFNGFRVPTLYKDRVLLHSCLACSTPLLSLLCRQVEGICSKLLVTLSASVDLLQSHNFLSSVAASLDSTGVILTGLATAISMQRHSRNMWKWALIKYFLVLRALPPRGNLFSGQRYLHT